MSQETNLNVAPYFDDFDATKNYKKVLFKPGFPIQARELNSIQSALQSQIEAMGDNLYQEGSVVIPGSTSYKPRFQCIQVQSEFLGVPILLYLDQLIGKKITGRTSGVTARVVTYITNQQSDKGNYTLYLNYEDSSNDGNSSSVFFDDEILTTNTPLGFGNSFIAANEGFANTITNDAAQTGTAFTVSAGIYYLRGNFVTVDNQILILDQYITNSSYRIGFQIEEKIITSDDDGSLFDNASGFNNYTAPGADRFQISATLAKKERRNFDTQGFVQIAEVYNGQIKNALNNSTKYSELGNELANRTFDESGHYYISVLQTKVKESLNNLVGNKGVYFSNQSTQGGAIPSDDLMIYQVSPGKAYVRGFETEIKSPQFIDVPKPRTTRTVNNSGINFDFAPTLEVNNVLGSAPIGFNTTNTLSLRDQRVGENRYVAGGVEIGKARIYDFALETGAYNLNNSSLNQWDLSLFDIDLKEDIELNVTALLEKSTYVEGTRSGASGYISAGITSTTHSLMSAKGNFISGEALTFSGYPDLNRTLISHRKYTLSDVKSVHAVVGTANTFTADVLQKTNLVFDTAGITTTSAGVSTVTIPGLISDTFVGVVTTGNLITFERPGFIVPSMARIVSVGNTNFSISGITTVTGIVDGELPDSSFSAYNLKVVTTKLKENSASGNSAGNNTLFSALPNSNIQSVNLANTSLTIRDTKTATITNGNTGPISVDDVLSQVWMPFDEERYSLHNEDGSTQILTSDKFTFNSERTTLTISGLDGSGSATLVGTISKNIISSKEKRRVINNSILIDKSTNPASGITADSTLTDGLEYGAFPFGTRVQDETISLNAPDVFVVHAVYESIDLNDPQPPIMTCNNFTGTQGTSVDVSVGDTIIGRSSQAKALVLERASTSAIKFAYLNTKTFSRNETVFFEQSRIQATAAEIDNGSPNITKSFIFDNGQRETHYDYSRIRRVNGAAIPSKKLLVYFGSCEYNEDDLGDITTTNSYRNLDYGKEVQIINGFRNSDLIDLRPRVSNYTVSSGANSPFEFDGRTFDNNKHSSSHIIARDSTSFLNFSYYLGRADRVYLTKNGDIQVTLGAPSDKPELPDILNGALNIANVFNPPYLYNIKDSKVKFIEHKRYQMSDIAKLDSRIKNLEYYTSLNLLEQNTLNTFVSDVNGLNRFKSGIFVDNFSSFTPQDVSIGIRNSIDPKQKILRPSHYSTAVNLVVDNNTDTSSGATDLKFTPVGGQNVTRTGDVVSLSFNSVSEIVQPYATRVENVTPFLIDFYEGSVALNPTSDVWVSTQNLDTNDVVIEGNFESVVDALQADVQTGADGLRTGLAPTLWDSWETTGINIVGDQTNTTETFAQASTRAGRSTSDLGLGNANANLSTINTQSINGTVNIERNRTGVQQTINEILTQAESLGSRLVNRTIEPFMRERNIEFTGTRMKPNTQVFSFFDNQNVTLRCTPKLLEIAMESGSFQVGETVHGIPDQGGSTSTFRFRVARANHKYGAFNDPNDFYDFNPYIRGSRIPSTYSNQSPIINVDTNSLASEDTPEFFGNAAVGMKLIGQTSGAEAVISNLNLITDNVGTVIGSFNVPDQDNESFGQFHTGRNVFKLTSSLINSAIAGTTTTEAEEIFYSQSEVQTTEEVTLSLRNARIGSRTTVTETGNLETTINQTIISNRTLRPTPPPPPPPAPPRNGDPLAQTFKVDSKVGIYATKVDLFFQTKDEIQPVTVQIRETSMGTPIDKILAYSEVTLDPDSVNVSNGGTVSTTFNFESPVFLRSGGEYALVVLSNVTTYNVWISRLGEADVTTLSTESGRVLVTEQPLLGSLFKSQNASVWTPSQYEDLKFVLSRADFTGSGNIQFFNPELDEKNKAIRSGGVLSLPRTVSVGIGTTINQSGASNPLVVGNRVTQFNTGANGILQQFSGIATGAMFLTAPGIGYTPSSGINTFIGVALTSITGSGVNATADIIVLNGVAIGATINSGGSGYIVGDVVAPISIGAEQLGGGAKFTIGIVTETNGLLLTDVQGNFSTNSNDYLEYNSSGGTRISINAGAGGSVAPASTVLVEDGLHLKIYQRNHGMNSNINTVELSDVPPSSIPTVLLTNIVKNTNATISIANTNGFENFENVGVSNTNPGFVKIGEEVISYNGVTSGSGTSGTLTGVVRSIRGNSSSHKINDLVTKYEFNNVSLLRINRSHDLSIVTRPNAIGIDHYHVKLDMSDLGTNRTTGGDTFVPQELYLTGGSSNNGSAKGTYNIAYSLIIPNISTTSPEGTHILSSARTISETSVNGGEISYLDQGYQDIQFNKKNYFETLRMIASGVNQGAYLNTLPNNKSFTINMDLISYDRRISPMIDLNHSSVVLVSNRINSPISDYANDSRTSGIIDDPNSMIYVTKNIVLENPATSIKVFIDGYIHNSGDVRMFYAIDQDIPANETTFTPFPGLNNLDSYGNIIDLENVDGTPDLPMKKFDVPTPTPSINQFTEFKFTMDNLPPFKSFRLKLVGSSSNQAIVPQFRNLRAIALA